MFWLSVLAISHIPVGDDNVPGSVASDSIISPGTFNGLCDLCMHIPSFSGLAGVANRLHDVYTHIYI